MHLVGTFSCKIIITCLIGDKFQLPLQSIMEYTDLFVDTWKAFTDYPVVHLKSYADKKVFYCQCLQSVCAQAAVLYLQCFDIVV